MKEYLHPEEEKLLEMFYKHYKTYASVCYDFSYYKRLSASRDKNTGMLDNILQSLYIRGYIQENLYTKTGHMSDQNIMLTEKALNMFARRMREEKKKAQKKQKEQKKDKEQQEQQEQKEQKEEKDLPKE